MLKQAARKSKIRGESADELAAERPQVIMVDDDQDFQFVLRSWLTPHYDTVSIASGEELLEELPTLEPDLVIMDVKLPGPDGFKLCEKIHAEARLSQTPILFLTGCKSDEDFIKNLEVGGAAYVTKPVERRDLLSKIRDVLED